MKQTKVWCFLAFLLLMAARMEAQEFNSVPLDHPAYEIITMGVMRGAISPPPSAKPWSAHVIKAKLWEMMNDINLDLNEKEDDAMVRAFESLERDTAGFDPKEGRYRAADDDYTFEAGFGWESNFLVEADGGTVSSVNLAKAYADGDIADFLSWNVTALGEILYIERTGQGWIPSAFPYAFSKQWDGGVLSLKNPGVYAGWPDDAAIAYGLEAEFNGVFFDQLLQLRLGRIRRDWGQGSNGASLFINSHARPFTALEASFLPFSWLNISFLGGALEYFRESNLQPNDDPLADILMAAQIEFNPLRFIYLDIGAAAVLIDQPRAAFFTDLELRLPGLFTLWGSLFVDRLNALDQDLLSQNGNSFAFQAGIKTVVYWLPLAAFTLRYTKVEPYCYADFTSGGESLGYYLPPNSDELLLRFEFMPFTDIKVHVQFQMIRHGVEYEYGAVGGSSLYNTLDDVYSFKSFLMDGVYRWDNVIKAGGSINLKTAEVPLLLFVETGFILTNFTINGEAGIGNEGDYKPLNNAVYRPGDNFIFSIGFRLFP